MVKNIIILVLVFLSYILFAKQNSNVIIDTPDKSSQIYTINSWSLVAESIDHKIYFSGKKEGSVLTVVDKITNSLLMPDDTCEIIIPEDLKTIKDTPFYNDSIGLKNIGPYKTISYKEGTTSTFIQTVQNSGCLIKEGEITLFSDLENSKVYCDIKVQYEHLGC